MKTVRTEFATIHIPNNVAMAKSNEPFIIAKGQNGEFWAIDCAYSEQKAFGIMDALKHNDRFREERYGARAGLKGEYRVFRKQDIIEEVP